MTPIQQQRLIGAGLLVVLVAILAYVVLSKVGQHQSEKTLELPEPIEFSSVIEPIEDKADDDSEAMVDADSQQITPAMDTEVVTGEDETASEKSSAEAAAESEESDKDTQTETSDNTAETPPAQPVERPTAQADTPPPEAGSANADNPTVVAEPNAGHTVTGDRWLIQLGSFSVQKNAQSLKAELEKLGYKPYIENSQTDKGAVYRVRLPAIANRAEADDIAARIAKQLDIKAQVITQ